MNNANEVRNVMAQLGRIAEKYDCAILLVGHYDILEDDLLSGIPREKKSEQAENLIFESLSKGKYPQQTLLKKTQAMEISKRVLDEAKKTLYVQSFKEGSQWYWRLPEKTE